uniref:hypothetical protein n=1 Tax=Streptomyces sp. SID8382 TaxID=2690362 RepID=UPI001F324707|nr:hypothetical protein [Streptomyces sp. SID8382]
MPFLPSGESADDVPDTERRVPRLGDPGEAERPDRVTDGDRRQVAGPVVEPAADRGVQGDEEGLQQDAAVGHRSDVGPHEREVFFADLPVRPSGEDEPA